MGADEAISASHPRRASRGSQPHRTDIWRWVLLSAWLLLYSAYLQLCSCRAFSNSDAFSPDLLTAGTDTHLVIRPLMEKVEVKNYDAALRKITFPHVSIIL